MTNPIPITHFADIMGVSIATVDKWGANGTLALTENAGERVVDIASVNNIPEIREMIHSQWDEELNITPNRKYNSIELFAGAGGLALGLEYAGFSHIMLNEIDPDACATLRKNRPEWNIQEGDVRTIDFSKYRGQVDLLSGGFPCQAFSFAGKQGGFQDARGTLFFEIARAIKEIQPKVFFCENVKGLMSHDNGRTISVIENVIAELGYTLVTPRVLKAVKYKVPQKRERLILIGIRNDIAKYVSFKWPSPYHRVLTLQDAFYKGLLYEKDVPTSEGQKYPKKKAEVLKLVPMGGYWKDLPEEIQKQYMGKSFYLGGGKTGMARRLSLKEPSLTLTCAPAQKQTERCHPIYTRPLTIREYARIQTFPDEWVFAGSLSSQYKQIGNAVPVNLSYAIGRALIRLMNEIDNLKL